MNYLALLNGAIITDMVIIVMTVFGLIQSKSLKKWYNNFSLGAIMSDVFSIMFVIILAHFIYPYIFKEFKLINFIILAVAIQLIHDISFGIILKYIPEGSSNIFDTFKEYVSEHGFKILAVDAAMIISTILISTYLSNKSTREVFNFPVRFSNSVGERTDINIFTLVTCLYLLPYFLYSI